jgi:hypothetical protein
MEEKKKKMILGEEIIKTLKKEIWVQIIPIKTLRDILKRRFHFKNGEFVRALLDLCRVENPNITLLSTIVSSTKNGRIIIKQGFIKKI